MVNGKLLIRIGGGYMTFKEYMTAFGQDRINRNERMEKRNKRKGKKIGQKARALRHSGTTKVVGSADFLRSIQ